MSEVVKVLKEGLDYWQQKRELHRREIARMETGTMQARIDLDQAGKQVVAFRKAIAAQEVA